MDVVLIEGLVEGYHECEVIVTTGETFTLGKKIGSHGKAFCMV